MCKAPVQLERCILASILLLLEGGYRTVDADLKSFRSLLGQFLQAFQTSIFQRWQERSIM